MVHVGVVWTNIKSRSERGCQRAFPILRSIGKAWLWFCALLTVWDCLCFGDLQMTGTVIVIVPRWIGSFHSNVIPPNFTVDPESGLSKQHQLVLAIVWLWNATTAGVGKLLSLKRYTKWFFTLQVLAAWLWQFLGEIFKPNRSLNRFLQWVKIIQKHRIRATILIFRTLDTERREQAGHIRWWPNQYLPEGLVHLATRPGGLGYDKMLLATLGDTWAEEATRSTSSRTQLLQNAHIRHPVRLWSTWQRQELSPLVATINLSLLVSGSMRISTLSCDTTSGVQNGKSMQCIKWMQCMQLHATQCPPASWTSLESKHPGSLCWVLCSFKVPENAKPPRACKAGAKVAQPRFTVRTSSYKSLHFNIAYQGT